MSKLSFEDILAQYKCLCALAGSDKLHSVHSLKRDMSALQVCVGSYVCIDLIGPCLPAAQAQRMAEMDAPRPTPPGLA